MTYKSYRLMLILKSLQRHLSISALIYFVSFQSILKKCADIEFPQGRGRSPRCPKMQARRGVSERAHTTQAAWEAARESSRSRERLHKQPCKGEQL